MKKVQQRTEGALLYFFNTISLNGYERYRKGWHLFGPYVRQVSMDREFLLASQQK